MKATQEKPYLAQSVQATREVAVFFDRLLHELKAPDQRQGRDLVKVARRRRLAIPRALEGYRITYSPRLSFDEKDRRRMVVVELPPRPGTPDVMALSLGGCAKFSGTKAGITIKGKVCVNCTVSLSGGSCKVTLTATISL